MTLLTFYRYSISVGFINPGSIVDRLPRQGSAQESKYNRPEERPSRRPEGLGQKERCPLVDPFGPPLRSEHSLRPPVVSGRPLRSEGLAQSATSDPRPRVPQTGARRNPAHRSSSTGALRADWSHPTGGAPFGRNQKTCGEMHGKVHKSKPLYQRPYPTRSSTLQPS